MKLRNAFVAAGLVALAACFGSVSEPMRHYYTLHLEPLRPVPMAQVQGLLRVRDLDAESAYDRFQIVMRRSPFELLYRNREVWAVKPNRMISDLIARGIMEQEVFSGVSRELSERRPDYLLSGELHSIEIYDSGDAWFAHAAFSLQITHFESGKLLWTYHFDERKNIPPQNFALAVRALSELLTDAIEKALVSMERMRNPEDLAPEDIRNTPLMRPVPKAPAPAPATPPAPPAPPEAQQQPIYVPETPAGMPNG